MAAPPLIVDAHNDLLLELHLRREEQDPFGKHWLPKLEAGGVGVQICPIYAAGEDEPRRVALAQVNAFERAIREHGDRVVHARTRSELDRALEDGRLALILSFEGVEALEGDPAAIDEWWERGVRVASLTWNYANAFAGGLDTPDDGLTAPGRVLVERMAALGMPIDLVHSSPRTFDDVLEHAPDARVCVTHAGCRAVHDHPRNLTDDQLGALASRGGILGLMALTLTVGRDRATLDRFLDHLDHAVSVMGIEHVGLGADFIDQVITAEQAAGIELAPATLEAMELGGGVLAIRELVGPEDYPALVDALRARGYEGERLDAVLGGNWLRLLRDTLPA